MGFVGLLDRVGNDFFFTKKKTTVASWLLGQDYLVLPSFFLCVMANKAPQGVGGGGLAP